MAATHTIDSHTQNDLSTLPPVAPNNNLTLEKSSSGQQHFLAECHPEGDDVTQSPKRSTSIKRQPRVGQRPPNPKLKFDGMERMRQETKLVVLEYLSNLPSEQISARNKHYQKERGNSVVKARTIHSCERPFVEVIEKKKREHSPLKRRKSEQYDKKVREKLQQMAHPIRKRLSPAVLQDIKQFDKGKLRDVPQRKNRQSLPFLRFQAQSANNAVLDTPVTCVAIRLEEMSEDIMKDYPELLDEHLSELLTPLEVEGNKLTYEDFAKVAEPVFEKQLARFTGSIWTKVALVFYLVKEVLYSGNLTDIQVELLVEYATRFITETSFDNIKKEGGWVALESPHGDGLIDPYGFNGNLFDPLGDGTELDTVDGPHGCNNTNQPNENVEEQPAGYIDVVKNTIGKWTRYSAAALAVGIGFAYAYLKQQ